MKITVEYDMDKDAFDYAVSREALTFFMAWNQLASEIRLKVKHGNFPSEVQEQLEELRKLIPYEALARCDDE